MTMKSFFIALAILWAALMYISFFINGCTTEPDPPPAFVGHWAAPVDSFLVDMTIKPNHSFSVSMVSGPELLLKDSGTWTIQGNDLIMVSELCQQGAALVPCTEPDTIRVSITGNDWPVSWIQDGQILNLDFKRVNQ